MYLNLGLIYKYMGFKTKLIISESDNPFKWILVDELIYEGNTDRILVPQGFITDFASVPRVLWSLCPSYGKYTKAAVIHDYLYNSKILRRKDADGMFRRIMGELGVGAFKRYTMWAAVRMFGWLSY